MFLAAFLLGIGVGLVVGVAIAVREQEVDKMEARVDWEAQARYWKARSRAYEDEQFDRLFAHHFAEELAEEAELNRLFDQDR